MFANSLNRYRKRKKCPSPTVYYFFSPTIKNYGCTAPRDPFPRCRPWLPCPRRRPRRRLSVLLLLTLGAGSAPPPSTAAASLAALRHCSLCTRTFRLGLQRLPGVLRRPRPLGEPGLPRRALPQHVLGLTRPRGRRLRGLGGLLGHLAQFGIVGLEGSDLSVLHHQLGRLARFARL